MRLAGLYYREAGPSHYDNGGGSGNNPTGSPDIVANRLAMLAIAEEGPSLNPPPPVDASENGFSFITPVYH
jgi:hypothetical protein